MDRADLDPSESGSRVGHEDAHRISRGEVVERLEALENSLREMVEEVSVARRSLDEPAGEERPAPSDSPRSPTAERERVGPGASGGRASLRGSPLDILFHSTLEQDEDGAAAPSPPFDAFDEGRPPGVPPVPSEPTPSDSWLEDRASEVEPRRASILAERERLLGSRHPDTLWAAQDLAFALADAGELTPAGRLATRLVEERTRLLGHGHPHTERARDLRSAITGTPSGGRWSPMRG